MAEIDSSKVCDILCGLGISKNKMGKVIGTLQISFARQAGRTPNRRMILDKKEKDELAESLVIGAGLARQDAAKAVDLIINTVRDQKDNKVGFLKEGFFRVRNDEIEFDINE